MTAKVQHIAITRADGGLSLMQIIVEAPVACFSPDAAVANGFVIEERENGPVWVGGITDWGVDQELARADQPFRSWRRIDAADIPADRTFRAAWRDTGAVSVDMDHARAIHRDRLRELRAPKMAALDARHWRLIESGDQAGLKALAKKKQALRDVTADPAIDAAVTPDDLAAVMPAALA